MISRKGLLKSMELTQEQLDQIINSVITRVKTQFKKEIEEIKEAIPSDTISNKKLAEAITTVKEEMNKEVIALQEAVKKVAEEAEVKIKALTPPQSKPWWKTTLLDEM